MTVTPVAAMAAAIVIAGVGWYDRRASLLAVAAPGGSATSAAPEEADAGAIVERDADSYQEAHSILAERYAALPQRTPRRSGSGWRRTTYRSLPTRREAYWTTERGGTATGRAPPAAKQIWHVRTATDRCISPPSASQRADSIFGGAIRTRNVLPWTDWSAGAAVRTTLTPSYAVIRTC